ncbi:PqqD family protein [Aurantimicrobium minutum]|uniref:PqqD family protein n=1 Tax=Aurantimicrobium minutum TaxID=708131 RepID=UPI002474CC91|nr:PqqD family protein [Aurantimicrobium minutum]MDH6423396.1 hypothetical protein [Aurantimicrobium minutum]
MNPTKRDDLTIVPAHDGYLVTVPDSQLVTWLNRTAYIVLQLSTGTNSVHGIAAAVRELFDLFHNPRAEVENALRELQSSGLISDLASETTSEQSLLILVWAPGESISVSTLKNITSITQTLDSHDITHHMAIDNHADHALSRNRALSAMLMRNTFSHVLLMDATQQASEAVAGVSLGRILSSEHDFVSIPVKSSDPNWAKVSAGSLLTPQQLSGFSFTYNVMFDELKGPRVRSSGFIEASHTSTAAVVISRTGLEKLVSTSHVTRYRGLVGDGRIEYLEHYWGFFDTLVSSQRLVTGDVAFCERWRAAGGHIMADTTGAFGLSLSGAREAIKQNKK